MKDKKPNILFYIPQLSQEFGGVRQYSAGLLNLFNDLVNEYNFFILHDGGDPVIMEIVNQSLNLKIIKSSDYDDTTIENYKKNLKYYFLRVVKIFNKKTTYKEENHLEKIVRMNNINIIHCPYQFIPKIDNVKLISTMHDVQELYLPQFFTAEERAYRAVNYLDYIKRSDKVIVSYNHIKNDIINFFNKDQEKIEVLLLKMDNLWFKKYENNLVKEVTNFEKCIFYPANFWKHKNHTTLVEAIYFLKENKNLAVNLILTGDNKNAEGKIIEQLIQNYNLQTQIKILGIVDEESLYFLYKKATGVVIPTLYEAGSFPLMESILMEIPVICSNVTSLPETMGNDDYIFDPNSIEDIAEKIEKLWNNEDYRKKSIENNKKQQSRLINTKADSILKNIYSDLK